MICVDWCLLNIHKGSISSIADFFFLLFPTGHGLPAVILVYKGFDGTLCSSTAFVFTFFLLFAYIRWSVNGLDDNLVVKIKG